MTYPTKYKKSYCDKLVKHMSEGYSFESFGGVVSCGKQTLYDWANKYPEFMAAKKEAFAKCLLWWERTGHQGMFMGGKDNPFQSSMYNFQMAARFGWSAKVEQKVKQEITLENLVGESFGVDEKEV